MPTVTLLKVQAELANALRETPVTVWEARRFNKRVVEVAKQELRNLPVNERGMDWVRARISELRKSADGPASLTAIAHDLVALLTEGKSAQLRARRAWAMMFALPAVPDGLQALDRCPFSHQTCLGSAIIRLLSDKALFDRARTLSICGNRGISLVEFVDGDAAYRVGIGVGPAFDLAPTVGRWRKVDVAQLRPLHDLLKAAAR